MGRNGKMYGALPYLFSRVFPDMLCIRVVPTIIAALIFYKMLGFQDDDAHLTEFVVVGILLCLVTTLCVIAISSVAKTIFSAATGAILYNMLMLLFGGVFVGNGSKIPVYLDWIRYFSYYEQALEIVCANEFTDLEFDVDTRSGSFTVGGMTIDASTMDVKMKGDFFLTVFGMSADGIDEDYTLLFMWSAIFLVISALALQFMHRTMR